MGRGNYRKGSHSIFSIHLHLVWITKYRKKILSGDIAQRISSLICDICGKHQEEILKWHIAPEHLISIVAPPVFWRPYVGRGYFCCSSGNVTDEIIKQYIEQQEVDDTFRIDGE
ncbi:transposase [uncultured Desulfovibrio sp.]|uniref:transposase n=1 Tax=uncultured Desulfovibrio sp. TaxID=167968 RepID=UPI002615E79C|nr:transposase [uncultured Desulfovibrio sp.]